jgi:ribosomal protein S18 acetylase RimI-like enzyme
VTDIAIATQADKARLLHLLVLGFAADPIARWVTPEPDRYIIGRTQFFDAYGGAAFDHGTAFVANGGEAVALWLPPGVTPDGEAMVANTEASVDPSRMEEMGDFFGQMDLFHPHDPHWYLPLIATDPLRRGAGLGSALLEAALARVDADGLPAYLESSNAANVGFYERFGFEKMGEIRTASSPVMTPMLRPARPV